MFLPHLFRQGCLTALCAAAAFVCSSDAAFADHCRCGGGYSIGGCTTPSVPATRGTTYYSPTGTVYYYSPSYYRSVSPYYRSYPFYGYGYSRPGISISIGTGFGYGGHHLHGYSFGRHYGYGSFGFGSSLFHHHGHHHGHHGHHGHHH